MRRAVFTVCVSLALLLPATGGARQAQTLDLRGYVAIPLAQLSSGHLVVQARLNDVPGTFVLDTGAGRTVVELARQRKFRLGRLDATPASAIGAGAGGVAVRVSRGNRLRIGGYANDRFAVVLMQLTQVNLAFVRDGHAAIDGVIGADVLRWGAAVIDVPRNVLYLKSTPPPRPVQAANRTESATR